MHFSKFNKKNTKVWYDWSLMKNQFAVFADFHSVNDWGGWKPERKREKMKEN